MKVSELENKFANSINTEISLLDATLYNINKSSMDVAHIYENERRKFSPKLHP